MNLLKVISCLLLSRVQMRNLDPNCPLNMHSVDPSKIPYSKVEDLPTCMYSGHFKTSDPVVQSQDHNLFYWFFRQSLSGPLLLFLNGGPGCTDDLGIFLENGPLRVERTGPGENDFVLKKTNSSWASI